MSALTFLYLVVGNFKILFLVIYGWFFDYYRDWQKFTESHTDQVLVVYYEDMHKVTYSVDSKVCQLRL